MDTIQNCQKLLKYHKYRKDKKIRERSFLGVEIFLIKTEFGKKRSRNRLRIPLKKLPKTLEKLFLYPARPLAFIALYIGLCPSIIKSLSNHFLIRSAKDGSSSYLNGSRIIFDGLKQEKYIRYMLKNDQIVLSKCV